MSRFLTELEIKCCEADENLWELEAPLIYESDMLGTIAVPMGFFCDLASTRHIPLVSFIWGDRAHREAVIHDYLYRIDSNPVVSFAMANSVFLEAMESRGKDFLVKYPMFWGVWLGGYFSYHKRLVDWKPQDTTCLPTDSPVVQP